MRPTSVYSSSFPKNSSKDDEESNRITGEGYQSAPKAVKKQSRILQNPSKYRNLKKKNLDGWPETTEKHNASIYFHNDTQNWTANEYKEEPKHK